MAIKITSIQEAIGNTGLKLLIHGQAGSGKTVFCATGGVPTLIISAESGLLSLKDAPDYIQTVRIESIDDLIEVYDLISEDDPSVAHFEWICLDSISEIAEQVLTYEKTQTTHAMQAYGALAERMNVVLRSFRDLPNKNVLMTAKQERVADSDTEIVSYVPSMPGQKLKQGIAYLFDEVFAIRVEEEDGESYHTIQCNKNRKYEAKDRSGELEMFEEPSLKAIAAKILAGMPEGGFPEIEDEEVADDDEIEELENADEEVEDDSAEETETEDDSAEDETVTSAEDPEPEDDGEEETETDPESETEDEEEKGEDDGEPWICVDCGEHHTGAEPEAACGIDGCESEDFYQED